MGCVGSGADGSKEDGGEDLWEAEQFDGGGGEVGGEIAVMVEKAQMKNAKKTTKFFHSDAVIDKAIQ